MLLTPIRAVMACLVLVELSGCGNAQPSGSPATAHVRLSWANGADTVAGMAANSDAVAVMTVKSIAGTGADRDAGDGTPYTLFDVTVNRWLKGTGADRVTIKQSGDATTEVEDDPLLHVGETAVVFLHEFADGKYFIVAGPTGRFHLDDQGNLVPMPGSVLRYTGSLSAFVTALQG